MSLFLHEELWVVVQEAERPNAPMLSSGFSKGRAYRVLGLHCASETSEAYFILCNDRNEVWFISNQHFRVQGGEFYSRAVPGQPSERQFERLTLENSVNGNGHARYDEPMESPPR
jgi:hypothetical protein